MIASPKRVYYTILNTKLSPFNSRDFIQLEDSDSMCIIQAMNVLVLLALVALVAAKFEYTQEFQEWKVKYNKVYETKDLELRRQIIWESNKKFVENHNANADKFGFTVAMNKFADLVSYKMKRLKQCSFFLYRIQLSLAEFIKD